VITATIFEELGVPGARTTTELGLPETKDFDLWWPPSDYTPLTHNP